MNRYIKLLVMVFGLIFVFGCYDPAGIMEINEENGIQKRDEHNKVNNLTFNLNGFTDDNAIKVFEALKVINYLMNDNDFLRNLVNDLVSHPSLTTIGSIPAGTHVRLTAQDSPIRSLAYDGISETFGVEHVNLFIQRLRSINLNVDLIEDNLMRRAYGLTLGRDGFNNIRGTGDDFGYGSRAFQNSDNPTISLNMSSLLEDVDTTGFFMVDYRMLITTLFHEISHLLGLLHMDGVNEDGTIFIRSRSVHVDIATQVGISMSQYIRNRYDDDRLNPEAIFRSYHLQRLVNDNLHIPYANETNSETDTEVVIFPSLAGHCSFNISSRSKRNTKDNTLRFVSEKILQNENIRTKRSHGTVYGPAIEYRVCLTPKQFDSYKKWLEKNIKWNLNTSKSIKEGITNYIKIEYGKSYNKDVSLDEDMLIQLLMDKKLKHQDTHNHKVSDLLWKYYENIVEKRIKQSRYLSFMDKIYTFYKSSTSKTPADMKELIDHALYIFIEKSDSGSEKNMYHENRLAWHLYYNDKRFAKYKVFDFLGDYFISVDKISLDYRNKIYHPKLSQRVPIDFFVLESFLTPVFFLYKRLGHFRLDLRISKSVQILRLVGLSLWANDKWGIAHYVAYKTYDLGNDVSPIIRFMIIAEGGKNMFYTLSDQKMSYSDLVNSGTPYSILERFSGVVSGAESVRDRVKYFQMDGAINSLTDYRKIYKDEL